jgi:general stress protein 26
MTTFPETHRDLLDGQVASLATIDSRGFPQMSEVWFLLDDGEIKLSLNTSRHKTKNLSERPECSLLLLDLENPYRYLKVGAKYGADLKVHDRPGESRCVVTIEPVKIHPVDMGG